MYLNLDNVKVRGFQCPDFPSQHAGATKLGDKYCWLTCWLARQALLIPLEKQVLQSSDCHKAGLCYLKITMRTSDPQ